MEKTLDPHLAWLHVGREIANTTINMDSYEMFGRLARTDGGLLPILCSNWQGSTQEIHCSAEFRLRVPPAVLLSTVPTMLKH